MKKAGKASKAGKRAKQATRGKPAGRKAGAGFDYAGLFAWVLGCLVAGSIGGLATYQNIPTWYASLAKPWFTPPSWLFGPAWTVLFILMGAAAFLVWRKRGVDKRAMPALGVFAVQMALNIGWSFAFFGLKSPFYGLVEIIFLYAAILVTIAKFHKIDRNAALLLVPYILWVTFAALLNYSVFALNP